MAHEPREFDGTSQVGRSLGALEPGHAAVDERTVEELVAYVHEYARGLVYHGPDDRPAGDFRGFVGELSPAKVAAFLREPERFDPARDPELFRPHFALFVAFLGLLERARIELNKLTARHLEFYYRDVLRMTRRRPVADRVNLVFALAKGEREALIPAGSRLDAGPDSIGIERIYTTDRDLVVNRAQIASVRSVLVDRRITGFKQARARAAKLHEDAGLWMLRIALGDPSPGDPLPLYPDGTPVDLAKLKELDDLTQSLREQVQRSLPEIRDEMTSRDIAAKLTGTPHAEDQLAVLWAKIREIETYFFVDAERFHQVAQQIRAPNEAVWDHVDAILDAAHKEKVRAARRRHLKQIDVPALDPEARLGHLVRDVLADPSAAVDALAPFCPDLRSLRAAAERQDWERVYSILEVALRNRIGEPPAQQEEWHNLYPADDALAAGARKSLPGLDGSPRWAPFGLRPDASPDVPPAPVLGWAISSPLLALGEGTRTITLTLRLRADEVDPATLSELLASEPSPLRVEISTAEGWIECHPEVLSETWPVGPGEARPGGLQAKLKVTLEASVAPLAAMPAALADVESPWPVLRLMLRPVWSEALGRHTVSYREFGGLIMVAVRLDVAVKGLKALTLQNDDANLNPRKPFEPFGNSPAVGSRLLLGHREIVDKKLDCLTFQFQWMKPPPDLTAHYRHYGLNTIDFTARVSVVDRYEPTELLAEAKLFGAKTDAVTTITVSTPVSPPRASASDELDEDLSAWPRCFQWELNAPDFQHSAYTAVSTRKANELAAVLARQSADEFAAAYARQKADQLAVAVARQQPTADAAGLALQEATKKDAAAAEKEAIELAAALAARKLVDVGEYTVLPPYTPKITALTIDYAASQEIPLDAAKRDPGAARMYHIHPFGACDVEAERSAQGLPLLPRHDADGELYIGLKDVAAPQSVSILFQLAEGSADPDLAPQRVMWSYLSGDRWVPFDHRVIADTTRSLLNTGIVELALEPAAPSARVRGGLYWVRAAVARDTASVCDVVALHTQVASATFADQSNAPDHFSEPLPAGTIAKLAADIPEITAVLQPFTSHGGRPAEGDGLWATRVSERLRHRNRALSTWDYERLVLDRFPEVYKAKCIPAGPDAPGEVRVIVIPDVRRLVPADPFEPRAPARLLADIEGYLGTRAPAFVRVRACHPRYVAVRLHLRVRFAAAGNEVYYTRRLNDEINQFLSPWAYKEGGDVALGGRIYANSILDFVDRRPYVDYVVGLQMLRSDDGEKFTLVPRQSEGEGEFVAAGRPDAVLVAARSHVIYVLHDAVYQESLMTGINLMKVELDFIVA